MKYLIKYLSLFFFIQSVTFAQSYNNIQILDATSGSPLAYARIYNTETGRGLITNEDGVFRNAFHDTTTTKPTIRITHIGYETVFFSPAKLNSLSIIKLKTNTYSLAEVIVMPKSWAMDFLHQVIKNHVSQSEQFQTYKTYLIANSTIDDTPVELIQAYYNAEFSPFTVDSLRFKSGRIAHAPYNNTYFFNLNPANLFSQFHPFKNRNSSFPPSFTANMKIKNMLYYDVKLVKEVYYEHDTLLYFSCIAKVNWLMNCAAVVRKSDKMFQSLHYKTQTIPSRIFQPINEKDKILRGSLAITVDFHQEQNVIQSMNLHYDIDYEFGNGQQSEIKYDSKLLAMEGAFYQTPNIYCKYKPNTYDLTFALNYYESLWKKDAVVLSNSQKQSLAYFRSHGQSINYGDSAKSVYRPYSSLWRWSNSPVQISDLNSKKLFDIKKGESTIHTILESDLINFDIQIILNIFNDGETVTWNTSTVLNRKESYCFHEKKDFYEKYLNLCFDVYEVYRRKFEIVSSKKALSKKISQEDIFDVYDAVNDELHYTLRKIKIDLSYDKELALKKWQRWVKKQIVTLSL